MCIQLPIEALFSTSAKVYTQVVYTYAMSDRSKCQQFGSLS